MVSYGFWSSCNACEDGNFERGCCFEIAQVLSIILQVETLVRSNAQAPHYISTQIYTPGQTGARKGGTGVTVVLQEPSTFSYYCNVYICFTRYLVECSTTTYLNDYLRLVQVQCLLVIRRNTRIVKRAGTRLHFQLHPWTRTRPESLADLRPIYNQGTCSRGQGHFHSSATYATALDNSTSSETTECHIPSLTGTCEHALNTSVLYQSLATYIPESFSSIGRPPVSTFRSKHNTARAISTYLLESI